MFSSSFLPLFEHQYESSPSNLFSESLMTFLQSTTSYMNEQVSEAISNASKLKERVQKSTRQSQSTHQIVTRNDHPWATLPLDLAALIASYLTPQELSRFAQVDKFSRRTFHHLAKESSGYWDREFHSTYSSSMISPQIHSLSLLNYLQCNLLSSQVEYYHYKSLSHHYHAIYEYHSILSLQQYSFLRHSFGNNEVIDSGIIGLVCDIAWTDSPLLSAVLSKKRYMTMTTILTNTISDVHKFKKLMNCDRIRSFLPVRSTVSNTIDIDLLRVQANEIEFPGFLGYAVNLIRLLPQHEYLRYTVFWGLFRDLMVFNNRISSELYGRTLTPEEMEKYWVVTLEDYSEEILQSVYPRLAIMKPRPCYYQCNQEDMMRKLEDCIDNGVISYSIARCTY